MVLLVFRKVGHKSITDVLVSQLAIADLIKAFKLDHATYTSAKFLFNILKILRDFLKSVFFNFLGFGRFFIL